MIPLTALLTAAAIAASSAEPDARALLDRTVWIDIGFGRTLKQLSSKQLADLRTCKEATMGFLKSGNGIAQTYYSGIALHTEYPAAVAKSEQTGTTIFLYPPGSGRPAESLRLSKDETVLVQQTPGFRPHTFLKCIFPLEKSPAHGQR